jgi:hypothetical protein
MEMTHWFTDMVHTPSPSKETGATVDPLQMRRIVCWLKAFARSREHWDLPGGLLISVLVVESYRPDFERDDVSLYNTMVASVTAYRRLRMCAIQFMPNRC